MDPSRKRKVRLIVALTAAVILATANLGLLTRYTRSAVLEVMDQDYIRAARAKGCLLYTSPSPRD